MYIRPNALYVWESFVTETFCGSIQRKILQLCSPRLWDGAKGLGRHLQRRRSLHFYKADVCLTLFVVCLEGPRSWYGTKDLGLQHRWSLLANPEQMINMDLINTSKPKMTNIIFLAFCISKSMFWQKITKADQFLVDLVYSLGLGKGPRVFTIVFQYGNFLVNSDPSSCFCHFLTVIFLFN